MRNVLGSIGAMRCRMTPGTRPRYCRLVDLPILRYRRGMNTIILEIALILLLVVANGLFAMA